MPDPVERLLIHTDGESDSVQQLLDWLDDEDALRGRVSRQPVPIREGDMGGVAEILTIALSGGVTVTALARSLTTWLTHRRADLNITVTRANGDKVVLNGKRVDTQVVLQQLQTLSGTDPTPR